MRRHRTASELGLESRRAERARTAPHGVPAVRRADPVAYEVPPPLTPELEQQLGDRVAQQLRELAEDLTPPPVHVGDIPREPSATEAWHHASNVNTRTVNLLAAIAQSSGVGMRMGDEVADLGKKLRFWRRVLVGVLVPVGGALIAVALKLYQAGYDDGLAAAWRTSVDQRLERLDRERRLDRRFEAASPPGTPGGTP
jgi:hypothetical protein